MKDFFVVYEGMCHKNMKVELNMYHYRPNPL